MAQVFALNSTSLTYPMQAYWQTLPVRDALDGVSVHNRYRNHIWQTNVMSAAEFDTLRTQLGQKVSITTTDYDNPNSNYKTYYVALFSNLTGSQDDNLFRAVQCQFKVKL